MRHIILLAALLCGNAQAACLPAQLKGGTGSEMVVSYNKQGAASMTDAMAKRMAVAA